MWRLTTSWLAVGIAIVLTGLFGIGPSTAQDKEVVASLASMPQSAERDDQGNLHGAYVELIKGLDQLNGRKTKIIVAPFQRSVKNLIAGRADFHIPLIKIPGVDVASLPYAFSSTTLFQVPFVLYTNAKKPLDLTRLGDYQILTDLAHVSFFPFKTKGSTCLPCAIKMVNTGRIDGFIFAQNEIDPYIHTHRLANVRRQLYKNFDVKILIPKGPNGEALDRYFSEGIQTLKEQGLYDKLLAPVLFPYKEWQPSDPGIFGG